MTNRTDERRRGLCCAVGVLFWALVGGQAQGRTVAFDLQLANPGTSIFRLTHTSESPTARLAGMMATIGHREYNFDIISTPTALQDEGQTLTASLLAGDGEQGGLRTDVFSWAFEGFEPGDRLQFSADIDLDTGDSPSDFRTVYFNNGDEPNMVVTVWFTDGSETYASTLVLPDDPEQLERYDFIDIPEPVAGLLMWSGLVMVVGRPRR